MRHRLLRAICIALLPLLLSACWQDAPPVESSLLPQEEEPSDTGSLSLPEQFSPGLCAGRKPGPDHLRGRNAAGRCFAAVRGSVSPGTGF